MNQTKKARNSEDQKEIEKFNESAKVAQSEVKRFYKNDNKTVDHDLYKLEVSSMLHDKGIQGREKKFVPVEHCHFFHSCDSTGRKQTYSTSIMGHCHKIDVMKDENGELIAKSGKSVIKEGTRTYDMKESKSVHTHNVIYQHSERIEVRRPNKEAQKALGGL